MNLSLAKKSNFGTVECGFWTDENNEIWMTREQIGSALGYSDPRVAVAKIHERNKERLDRFSVVTKLTTTDGKAYDTYLYNHKGLYEICRLSRQPLADAFMDWAWDVIESIRKTGSYNADIPKTLPEALRAYAVALEEKMALEHQIEQDKPRVLFSQAVEASDTSILVGDLAKILKQNGIDVGQNRLFQWLRDNGYLIKSGNSRNMPTQYSMDRGWFEIQERVIQVPNQEPKIMRTPRVTGKGQMYFVNRFMSDWEKVAQ